MDFNIFPAPEFGQVPPGVTWVEIPVYSQNLDMVEQRQGYLDQGKRR